MAQKTDLIRRLVSDIQNEPFQPYYRRRCHGLPVKGWDQRQKSYFWPKPTSNWVSVCHEVDQILEDGSVIVRAVHEHLPWTTEQKQRAIDWARRVFKWGGVPPRRNVTWEKVRAVIEAALSGNEAATAPMNSGWTKVAAFASDIAKKHKFAREGVVAMAIWDSRVATSIIYRLDRLIAKGGNPQELFPDVGTIPGRGGSRPRSLQLKWPVGWGSWRTQVQGSKLIESILAILNSPSERDLLLENPYPTMSFCTGDSGSWDTRGVEMVLFMDGY